MITEQDAAKLLDPNRGHIHLPGEPLQVTLKESNHGGFHFPALPPFSARLVRHLWPGDSWNGGHEVVVDLGEDAPTYVGRTYDIREVSSMALVRVGSL